MDIKTVVYSTTTILLQPHEEFVHLDHNDKLFYVSVIKWDGVSKTAGVRGLACNVTGERGYIHRTGTVEIDALSPHVRDELKQSMIQTVAQHAAKVGI